jgi:hypothetical protein
MGHNQIMKNFRQKGVRDMKKYFTLLLMVLFLIVAPSTSYAKIEKIKDSFDGTLTIRCYRTDVKPFQSMMFAKLIRTDKSESIFLRANMSTTRGIGWYFFSDTYAEMKVDDDKIYNLKIIDTQSQINILLDTNATIKVTPEIADIIKKANKLTFRFFFDNQQPVVVNLSDKALKEWQEVINTNK